MPRLEEGRRNSLELLGVEASGVAAAERVVEIPVSSVRPNPHQPRRQFPPESLMELAGSIKTHGLQQPIIVRQLEAPAAPGGADAGPAYELILGERRLRAHQIAGFKTVRAIIRKIADTDMLRLAIVENVHREDLPLMDRANSFCRFKDEFHAGKVDPAAEDLKVSRRTGFNYSKIGAAEPKYQALIVKHELDVRGSNFLLSLAGKVAKELPGKTEAFEKAINNGELGFATLKRLHDEYFPAAAAEDEKPRGPGKTASKGDAAPVKDALYRKTEAEVALELSFDPRKMSAIDTKLREKWAKAAQQFFKAAGFAVVEIKYKG